MPRSRRVRRDRGLAAVMSLFVLIGVAVTASPGVGPAGAQGRRVSAAMFRKALGAERGDVVRAGEGIRVTRVSVRHRGGTVELYVVRVAGDFPPRALRYTVRAGGERVGYGVPVADGSAVETVTRDPRVLDREIAAHYDSAASRELGAETFAGATGAGEAITDPAVRGPHQVVRRHYDLGDAFQPTNIGSKVEVVGQVHHPADLENGPYPLVLFLHGNHSTCFKGQRTRFQWPCRGEFKPIPNYRGYRYIAERLASHGYIVVSVAANGINVLGSRIRDTGMRQRGELLDHHVELWDQWSSEASGPFGDLFVGAVDMDRIGTMGHSRGGEGVVWHKIVDDERAVPFGIDAVLALAPVDFTGQEINNVPFAVMLPYCDGDVSDLQGIHFFDDSRYNVPGDTGAKHTVSFFGANHNFFNQVWSPSSRFPGTMDDAEFALCQERWGERKQRRIGRSYVVGFFRRYLAPDLSLDPMWTGEAHPAFTGPDHVLVNYLAPASHRRDLVRYTGAGDLIENQMGGDMVPEGMSHYGWCEGSRPSPCLDRQSMFYDRHMPGLARGVLGWRGHDAVLTGRVPGGMRDVSAFETFQFRVLVPPGFRANRAVEFQDLSVALVDGAGGEAELSASEVGNRALRSGRGFLPHYVLQQVRFPLDLFDGVDLSDVVEVQFRFNRMRGGVVQVSDVAFSSGGS